MKYRENKQCTFKFIEIGNFLSSYVLLVVLPKKVNACFGRKFAPKMPFNNEMTTALFNCLQKLA
jgi:hypothetical protein